MEIPKRWGFCMAGNEQAFCDALDLATNRRDPADKFIYYEIGVGNGETMEAVHSWLTQRNVPHVIIGVDLPGYTGTANEKAWPDEYPSPSYGEISLAKVGSEVFLSNITLLANFIFIDACHGAPCVTRDFLLSEKKIKPGGVICFHDTDPLCQGNHFQAHCGTGIDARRAVQELGLLDDSRPGWKKVNETFGDMTKGAHGALWVQRIS